MARRQEIAAIYTAAVVQGVALVTFPAVGAILTSPAHYGLTTTRYGGLFVPQAITAILASLLGAGLTRRVGGKQVLWFGLAADGLAMTLLFLSQFALARPSLAYGLLLAATAFLGGGFGFVVPALNTFTAEFFPARVDAAILTLNALLGLGTALAPIFALIFVGLGFWWGLPILMAGLTLALTLFTLSQPLTNPPASLPDGGTVATGATRKGMPARFWIYAGFALLYGICETMNGNWASIYVADRIGAPSTLAALSLTSFWVSVTVGRVFFAAVAKRFPPRWTYRTLPLLLAVAFLLTAAVPRGSPRLAVAAFGLAGLGCSALLPLVISLAEQELASLGAAVAGGLIGVYQIGYGLAAFGVGPLQAWLQLDLGTIYAATAIFAVGLETLAIFTLRGIARREAVGAVE